MRVTEIVHPQRSWSPLVLHPRVTIITGERDQCADVVSVLRTLYSEAGSTVEGTLEFSGLQMPLDQTAVVSLDLAGSGLRSLHPEKLETTLSELRSSVVEATDNRSALLGERCEELRAEAVGLRRRRAASEAAISACQEEIAQRSEVADALRAELDAARRAPGELATAIEVAGAAADSHRCRIEAAEERVADLTDSLTKGSGVLAALRLGDARSCEAVFEVLGEARDLGVLRHDSVEVLEGWLARVAEGTASPSVAVESALEEIGELETEWNELTARGVEGDPEVVEARGHAQECADRYEALEELSASGMLAERARSEIDEAHDGGDVDTEVRVLGLYGFDSYLDYTIAISTRSVNDAIEATLQRARAERVRATDRLEAERERSASTRNELGERRDALRDHIRATTGMEPASIAAEDLLLIPEPDARLSECAAEIEAAIGELRSAERTAACELDALEGQRSTLADPAVIAAEVEERTCEIESLRSLTTRAESEVVDLGAEIESLRPELDSIESELVEISDRRRSIAEPAERWSATETAVFVRAVIDDLASSGEEGDPVLMDDSFGSFGMPAAEALEALVASDAGAQIVYVSSRPEIATWAKRQGSRGLGWVDLGRRRRFARRLARAAAAPVRMRSRLSGDT